MLVAMIPPQRGIPLLCRSSQGNGTTRHRKAVRRASLYSVRHWRNNACQNSGSCGDTESEGYSGANLAGGVIVNSSAAHSEVDRNIVLHLPNRPDQGRTGSEQANILFVKDLGDGPDNPVVWTLDDRIEEIIGMLLSGERDLRIEVDRSPVPTLRGNGVHNRSSPVLVIDPWQQDAEFGCNAGPGFFLQIALAQHAFEKDVAFNQASSGEVSGQTMSCLAFDGCFPAGSEAVIYPVIGSEQHAIGAVAKIFDRTQLDFDLTRLGDRCVGTIERTITPRGAAPASEHRRPSKRGDRSQRVHGVGRNTQIDGRSPEPARTATKSRSSSGTNREVRAPATVGTRAIRR